MEELGRVTGAERQKKNKSRVSVFVDGAYLGSVEDTVWARSGLKAGDILKAPIWEDMQARQEARAALDKALARLAARARSGREIERYLEGKGFAPEAIRSAVDKLKGYGYIDDEAFAAMLVRDRTGAKGAGRRTIEAELKRLGVDRETASSALAQYGEEEEAAAALRQAEKDMKRTAGESDARKRRAKVYASLARRGFSHDTISGVLARLFNPDDCD
jgi:regulatory protein